MLHPMQLPANLMGYALDFLPLMGGTLFMESMNISIAAVLRAHGHTRDAMLVTLGQNILNVAGNWVTLFGPFGLPPMGVLGVALSGVVQPLRILRRPLDPPRLPHPPAAAGGGFRHDSWSKRPAHPAHRPAGGRRADVLLVGLPLVTTFVARMGRESLAIQSYTLQIQRFAMLFSFSIGLGTEILIGHLVGAGLLRGGLPPAAAEPADGAACSPRSSCSCVAALGPASARLPSPTTPRSSRAARLLLRLAIILEPGRVFNVVVISSLRATGDVGFPIQMAVLSMWCVWVPLAWLLGLKLGLGLAGFWIAMITDEWLRGLLMYRRWKKRRWLKYAQRSRAHATGAGDSLPSL